MRNLEPNSIENANAGPSTATGRRTARTKTDVTSLLLELARALRGFAFYKETDSQRRTLLDRAFRAVSGELSRSGSIDVELTRAGFWIPGLSQTVESDGVLRPLEAARRCTDSSTCWAFQATDSRAPNASPAHSLREIHRGSG